MYKVFFNDREITISSELNITNNQTTEIIMGLHTPEDVKRWFSGFQNGTRPKALLNCDNEGFFWEKVFRPAFKFIEAAGGVVIRNRQLLVIFRNGKWDLPKGKIDKGETPEQAALREVAEECGIHGHSIVKNLIPTYHIYRSPYRDSMGEWMLKKTHWFEMAYSGHENGVPETGENITEIGWLPKSELTVVLENTYENLKQIFQLYLD